MPSLMGAYSGMIWSRMPARKQYNFCRTYIGKTDFNTCHLGLVQWPWAFSTLKLLQVTVISLPTLHWILTYQNLMAVPLISIWICEMDTNPQGLCSNTGRRNSCGKSLSVVMSSATSVRDLPVTQHEHFASACCTGPNSLTKQKEWM